MITKIYGKYKIVCDSCEESDPEEYYSWADAAEARRTLGYKTRKEGSEWTDTCTECQ